MFIEYLYLNRKVLSLILNKKKYFFVLNCQEKKQKKIKNKTVLEFS